MNELSLLEQLCFSTTRIETENVTGSKFTGTGFFFNLQVQDKIVPIVITNKHVVKGMSKGKFKLTKADSNNNPLYTSHFTIAYETDFEQMWIFHPDSNVDLCILPFNQLVNAAKQMGHTLFFRTFVNAYIPDKATIETLDAVEDIMMIGYPNGLWDSVNNMPIVRKGITATDPKLDYNGKKEFLIDAACFPGSSGSPIFICNKGYSDKHGKNMYAGIRFFFLGILYAGPQLTVTGDIKIVTIPSLHQKPLSVSQIPTNLGYVIKAEKILDFIPLIQQKLDIQK
ncbi:hypothetical protein FACS189441_0320 [Betaproteobacteria bacterium]|nr:hypothetical protein FACS189441_0320 [Betaproteobacteria bacterium]